MVGADGGLYADIRHAAVGFAVHIHGGGVHAEARQHEARREILVDGRRADGMTDVVAVHDLKAEAERSAQHGGDVFHLAVFNRFTDARGADPLAFIFHCGHDVHFAAVGFAELFQPLRVARRELTETEIRATGDALHVQTEAQKV